MSKSLFTFKFLPIKYKTLLFNRNTFLFVNLILHTINVFKRMFSILRERNSPHFWQWLRISPGVLV